jgi:cyclic pyranopterin phosphate synthase
MNDVDFPVAKVLEGIDAAAAAGLSPVKINMVVKRGVNEDSILPMARHFRGTGHILRFIEYMDVGHTNGWRMDEVVPARELVERISAEFPLEPVEANYQGEVAERWRYRDGSGEIGVIASVTQAFCRDCTRGPAFHRGQALYLPFRHRGHDLRARLARRAHDDDSRAGHGDLDEARRPLPMPSEADGEAREDRDVTSVVTRGGTRQRTFDVTPHNEA